MLQVDESSNINGAGLGIVLISPEGDQIEQAVRCEFKVTNNEAEYEALIVELVLAKEIRITRIHVYNDSQLIVNQIQGTFLAKDTKMTSYLELAKWLCKDFDEFHITQVPQTENIQPQSNYEYEAKYLQNDELPPDKNEARRTKAKATRFCIIDGKLNEEVEYVLAELHEGECGNHSGARSLVHRALTAGYYWLTMWTDSVNHVKKYNRCQRFANVSHLPPEWLNPIHSTWPFMKWGMDIIGKLPAAPGQRVFMPVVTDYFTKWIEVEALSKFISTGFQNFCKEWNIKLNFSTPRYPQANSQVKSSNKTVMKTIKKRLSEAKGKWEDEFSGVLWSYRTIVRTPTG
ncbi:uncharacterized protein LOC111372594 [Olea europaea var. sylvestris]|uniref:uncharacterized protein LOC111372594 n=1 Tax=Olea europaea var. sylvestris TaxID=158386 RepID=UPI000C1CDFC1|nr:uncharacterized protein LOC111372594 [Olea europaea var. sylvestris]